MDEVNKLLRQAWEEARKQGVALHSVDYRCARRIDGIYLIESVTFQADIDSKEQQK